MIFYYGLTDADAAFTLSNIAKITTAENLKALGMALLLAFISTVICLLLAYPLAMILAGKKCKPVQLYCPDLYPAHVDELLLRTLAWQTLLEKTG